MKQLSQRTRKESDSALPTNWYYFSRALLLVIPEEEEAPIETLQIEGE